MTKLSKKFWIALTVFSLVGQVAWVIENMYFNVFIYKMFAASPADIAAMVTASAISATVTTLLIGALSDKLGKRKIFISGGYILWGLSIVAFALLRVDLISSVIPAAASISAVGITLVIFLDCVMTFFGSSANDACFNAWFTDSTDSGNRGSAEGINAMMPLLAILVVFGSTLGMDNSDPRAWSVFFGVMGVVVLLIGILGFFLLKEPSITPSKEEKYFANIIYGFRPSVIVENKTLYVSLAAFAVFGISIQIFMPYLILYYTETLKLDNYVFIMAPAVILAAAATVFYGRVYDRIGFAKTVLPALGALCGGYLLFCFFTNTAIVFVASLLMMCGYLCGMAVFGALIRDYTPENMAGRFQGLRIFGQVLIPGIVGPFIGQKVLEGAEKVVGGDGIESFIPNTNIFVAAFFAVIVVLPFLPPIARLIKKEKTR